MPLKKMLDNEDLCIRIQSDVRGDSELCCKSHSGLSTTYNTSNQHQNNSICANRYYLEVDEAGNSDINAISIWKTHEDWKHSWKCELDELNPEDARELNLNSKEIKIAVPKHLRFRKIKVR